jgi:hypothetical protein
MAFWLWLLLWMKENRMLKIVAMCIAWLSYPKILSVPGEQQATAFYPAKAYIR